MLRTSRQISRLQGLWPRWQAAPARGLVGSLQSLRLDSTVVRELPGDSDTSNVPRLVNEAFYTPVEPTPVPEPRLRLVEERALEAVGLSPSVLDDEGLFADVFSGNATLEGSHPIAYAYGGHQFGNWAVRRADADGAFPTPPDPFSTPFASTTGPAGRRSRNIDRTDRGG